MKAIAGCFLVALLIISAPTSHAAFLDIGNLGVNLAGRLFSNALASGQSVVEGLISNKLGLATDLFKLIPKPALPEIEGLSGLLGVPLLSFNKDSFLKRKLDVHEHLLNVHEYLLNLGRDVVDDTCTPARFVPGDFIPAQCTGKALTLTITTGECEINPATEEITCTPPQVVLDQTAASCNLPYRERCVFTGPQCRPEIEIGKEDEGIIKKFKTKEINFGRTIDLPKLPLIGKGVDHLLKEFLDPKQNTTVLRAFASITKDLPLTNKKVEESPEAARSPAAPIVPSPAVAASPAAPVPSPVVVPSPAHVPSPAVAPSPAVPAAPSPSTKNDDDDAKAPVAAVVAEALADAVATTP